MCQIVFAIAMGFLLVTIFYRGNAPDSSRHYNRHYGPLYPDPYKNTAEQEVVLGGAQFFEPEIDPTAWEPKELVRKPADRLLQTDRR